MYESEATGIRPGSSARNTIAGRPTRLPAAEEMADYAAEVKRLSNYEVWRNVESAIAALVPGQEPDDSGWSNLRVLLDELKWRFSGLEGAGSASDRIPVHIYPN